MAVAGLVEAGGAGVGEREGWIGGFVVARS